MAARRLNGANGIPIVADFIDYGCAGRGNFDAFAKTLGRQVDSVDKLFYKWKKCIQCATGKDAGMVIDYKFNPNTKSCGESQDCLARFITILIFQLLPLTSHDPFASVIIN